MEQIYCLHCCLDKNISSRLHLSPPEKTERDLVSCCSYLLLSVIYNAFTISSYFCFQVHVSNSIIGLHLFVKANNTLLIVFSYLNIWQQDSGFSQDAWACHQEKDYNKLALPFGPHKLERQWGTRKRQSVQSPAFFWRAASCASCAGPLQENRSLWSGHSV